jgi:hypothetical protein
VIRPGGGVVPGMLVVDVRTAPPANPARWAGISGTALICGEMLVGIIVSYPPEFGGRELSLAELTPHLILQ